MLLSFWEWVLEFVEGSFDIAGHGNVDVPFVVVPVKGESEVFGALLVHRDGIKVAEGADEVVEMLTSDVLDSEVVDNECKCYGTMFVAP